MTFENADLMTAIVTPFDDSDRVDYDRLEKLINHLIETGSKGFVVGGTTGETPTLTHDEKIELYQKSAKIIDHRVPMIVGTGSNSTQDTIDFTKEISVIDGIDAALVVVPYYNKPNQKGMLAHFKAVAAESTLPIIIYNIPGRTGVTMAVETAIELSHVTNIIGIKQCTDIDDLGALVEHCASGFLVYSGEDNLALATKEIGGAGVISVASHVFGAQMSEMYADVEAGNWQAAAAIQRDLTPKMNALFMYPSPSPVKAALNHLGYAVGGCRLPILPLDQDEQAKLFEILDI
ncbi:dihydrodipicolinate synthase [Paucilactobacillus vaccinostercus DSM 20634]|jgi:4-hydroxy-tetrahydrodipicolinate synthase|uniref:4-hydroxy-tetrahydrodipicolinate synthase n=1 Tax=Paucilactobacillus vaccinostercus DSM 20634 TaxID=1423813 RepID=A0A0R2A6J4_9LACO|nr:4-hydroxy-tetrahydrodipicolinate synthase [Paucilactobacillus vaccinostercus]KRM62383.1 dihydrodipicolinate synthase [Paucilactobacillus vaccinostercus DSM 20634]RRG09578.1 MAG: 4-hydroxy-tetrahydrodipicolinate synthase [Lactobacillus sp.]